MFRCTNTDTEIEDLQLDNDELDIWSDNLLLKLMSINVVLYIMVIITPTKYENGIQKEIVNNDTAKDLGIAFDTERKFRKHVSNCINKGNK